MSHSTVTVVIKDVDSTAEAIDMVEVLLAPFDENMELDPPVPEWLDADNVEHAVTFYREHPEYCPGEDGLGPEKPFDEYVTEGNLEAWNEWTRQACGAYHRSERADGFYDAEQDRFGYYSTYNPDSRWDWWEIGGRWHGFYQLKPKVVIGSAEVPYWRKKLDERFPGKDRVHGEEQHPEFDGSQDALLGLGGTFGDEEGENFAGRADLARKGDIDFEAMRSLAGHQAEAAYDAYEKATVGLEPSETWQECWRRVYFDHEVDPDQGYDDYVLATEAQGGLPIPLEAWSGRRQQIMDDARRQFAEHPWVKALREAKLDPFMDDAHEYWCVYDGGRETFLRRASAGAAQTHAVLMDGKWYENGRMGWFGTVSGEKGEGVWIREFAKLIDSLPDDVYLCVVDVHI